MSSAPIADLSYRSYDGPLDEPNNRWWVISRMLIRQTFKKKSFWVWTGFAGINFYLIAIILYFIESAADPSNPQSMAIIRGIVWKDIFVSAFGHMQLFLLFIALLAGAGSIANDNRANALLVYLSKPCRKIDYLFGKWAGLAILISGVTFAQFTMFYLYGLMSYRDYGFVSQDPYLYPKLVLISIVPGVFYASVVLGISSLFNQGRMAGATFAGLYFITYFFTTLMLVVRVMAVQQGQKATGFVNNLTYASIDGVNFGIAKAILNTSGSVFGQNPRRSAANVLVPPPNLWLFLVIGVAVSGLFLWIAWKRVRAVEVVG